MLNVLRPAMDAPVTPAARSSPRPRITPNAITVIGEVGVAGGALARSLKGERSRRLTARYSCSSTCWTACWPAEGHQRHLGRVLDSTMDRSPTRHLQRVW